MTELLIIGGFLFVAYTLAQGNRARLAASGFQPNTLIQNTGGRSTVVTGEPNSPSPLALTQQMSGLPASAVIAPAIPPYKVMSSFEGPPVSNIPVVSGSTSFSTAADPMTGPVQIINPVTYPAGRGIVSDITI